MKRLLLLLLCATLMTGASYGYRFEKYKGVMFYALSPDGKYLVSSDEDGGVLIYNTETQETFTFESDYEETAYSVGLGNVVNKLGMVAGAIDSYTPAIFYNGTWTALPLKEGVKKGTNSIANGISADGSVVCGSISTSDVLGMRGTTYFPVVWTKGADGNFGTYEFLPCPTTDFTGRAPQYITALNISEDGKVIAGQVRSYDGFKNYPIVYTKGDDGNWTYKEYGLDELVKPGVEFPEYPKDEPKQPSIDSYMTEDSLTAYNNALSLYNDSVNLYNSGLIETRPTYPKKINFLGEVEKDAYTKAVIVYKKKLEAYNDSLSVFEEVYYDAITDNSYVFNTLYLSANGRYLAQTLEGPDENGDPLAWMPENIDCPVMFDLQNEGQLTKSDATKMTVFGVTNEGMMLAATPAVEYTRNSYVIPAGTTTPVRFEEWVKTKCDTASVWLKENMVFDVTLYDYDEEGNATETVVEDSLITGGMVCNPDGTIFVGNMYNYWAVEEENAGFISCLIDIADPKNPTSVIHSLTDSKDVKVSVKTTDGNISVSGEVREARIYDPSGRMIGSCNTNSEVPVRNGMYIVKVISSNGSVITKKVNVGR